jgi:V/A-type H+-transporting ATPase subunit E
METDKIREAILAKAKSEADEIIAEADAKAREMIQKAQDQKKQRLEEEKKKILSDAHREASRLRAQASLKARQGILQEKDAILGRIIKTVREDLSRHILDKGSFIPLVTTAINAFETESPVRIYVAPKDVAAVRDIIKTDSDLKDKILEVREMDCLGGVFAESDDSMKSIDNTYDMRLEMLMPKILPDIGKKLFGDE